MGVAPAGVKFENTGHHHLLIDTDAPADAGAPLPATDKNLHFGKGQTEASVPLSPGKHTLQLLLGDQNHVPHNPPVISSRITITVTGYRASQAPRRAVLPRAVLHVDMEAFYA